jgi:lipopolysaccharide assembly protein B
VHLTNARLALPQAVRTELTAAALALDQEQPEQATVALRAAALADPAFIAELLPLLEPCVADARSREPALALLDELVERDPGVSAVLARGEVLRREQGVDAERAFYTERLRRRPSIRVLRRMLEVDLPAQEICASPSLELSFSVLRGYLERKPVYRCGSCGFSSGRSLHWQ